MRASQLAAGIVVALITCPTLGSAEKGGRQADPLLAPENVTCTIERGSSSRVAQPVAVERSAPAGGW